MRTKTRNRWATGWLLALSLCALGWTAETTGQEPPAPTPAPPGDPTETAAIDLNTETIQRKIDQIEAATDLPETVKVELLGLYRQTLDQIASAANWATKAAEYQKGREEAPALLEAVKARLAQWAARPAGPPPLDLPPDVTLEQLSQLLTAAETDLKSKQESAKKFEDESKSRGDRRVAIPDLIAEANKRLEKITKDLAAPPAAGVAPQIPPVRRLLLQAQKKAAEQEIKEYDEELRYYDARSELLAARRDEAKLAVNDAQTRVTALQALVSERRQAEIERQKQQAEEELRRTPKPIREMAETNAQLADERSTVARQIDTYKGKAKSVTELADRLGRDFASAQESVSRPGMSEYVGPILRKQRVELARLQSYESELRKLRSEYARVQGRLSEIDEARLALIDLESEVASALQSLQEPDKPFDPTRFEPKVRELLTSRRDSLERLKKDYETYATDLIQLSTTESALLAKVHQFADFIDEHVLWIRSAVPLHKAQPPQDLWAVPQRLTLLGRALTADAGGHPMVYGLAALVLLVLTAPRRKLRALVRQANERAAKALTDSYGLTLGVFAASIVIVLPGPALLGFLGWRTSAATGVTDDRVFDAALAVGAGFWASALLLFTLSWVRQWCRVKGLAQVHFRWDSAATKLLRTRLLWATPVLAPLVFVVAATEHYPDYAWRESVGRTGYIALLLVVALLFRRLFSPSAGLFARRFRIARAGWLYNLRHGISISVVATPLALIGASAAGYHYAALEFGWRLVVTTWLILGLVLWHAMLVRWVFVTQRRLAIEQARAAGTSPRAPSTATKESQAAADGGTVAIPTIDEAKLDLVNVGEQTRTLLRTAVAFAVLIGLWATWSDMLPALSFMRHVKLWSYTVDAMSTGANGDTAAAVVGKRVAFVSLADVALALVIAVTTIVLARNIPGLIEIAILQRLPLDKGGRFAITAVARYTITVVGVVATFSAVGIGWSKVQWLVAAVTVGLGFGLQEIFANFISGLMLLFERPIRVGDTVTVGGISGTVTRIRIRATTITDWDRKELVIPNKEFITGQVVNWTLSDSTLRMVLPVGIAYGSDTDLAEKTLLTIARESPYVLDDPPPRVHFMAFGDSTLNFELRVFIANVDYLLTVRHEINKAIDREFRKAGIEIAFPQRDLHIRSIQQALPIVQRERETIGTDEAIG